MCENFDTYESIKNWKDSNIFQYLTDTNTLNHFHDRVMKRVFNVALKRLKPLNIPCTFTWFITGSGGRFEQGLISDQDHGIIFAEESDEANHFFYHLGEELSNGLYKAGYPYCEGKVMSSNPLWCKPVNGWKEQLSHWVKEETWEAIRYLQIFYDARVLVGNEPFLCNLKSMINQQQEQGQRLLIRFMENVMLVKKVLGPFGQIIIEENGDHKGSVDMKQSAFIPYVNAIRILAIKEGLHETSTLERINVLIKEKGYPKELETYHANFLKLLDLRNNSYRSGRSYEESHYLSIKGLDKDRKKEFKRILKDGKKLNSYVQAIID
ncbi:DUF294 nucleotidyltransferase-like domain-containing protein [Fredinandcohnia humi]